MSTQRKPVKLADLGLTTAEMKTFERGSKFLFSHEDENKNSGSGPKAGKNQDSEKGKGSTK